MEQTPANRLVVDMVSDPVCPWCFVGLKSLMRALEDLQHEQNILVRMRPFQLNRDTPEEGVDRQLYYQKKFPDKAFREQAQAALIEAARNVGFDFDPTLPKHLPNTLKAHQLLHWAQLEGKQQAVAIDLYEAFWERGEDIGSHDILAGLAGENGLDAKAIAEKLDNGQDRDLVQAEAAAFQRAGVSGVPTFIVNETTGFSGALPPEKLALAIQHAQSQTTAG